MTVLTQSDRDVTAVPLFLVNAYFDSDILKSAIIAQETCIVQDSSTILF